MATFTTGRTGGRRLDWQLLLVVLCILAAVLGLYSAHLRKGGSGGAGWLSFRAASPALQQHHAQPTDGGSVQGQVEMQPQQQQQEQEQAAAQAQQQQEQDAVQARQHDSQQQQQQQQPQLPPPPHFVPQGYQLPQECAQHSPLLPAIFDRLRPWMGRGITQADLDACAPVATGPPEEYAVRWADINRFRLLVQDGTVYITSGGLRRGVEDDAHLYEGLEYFQIKQIQDAARRFGLPNMEFAVGFNDLPHIRGEDDTTKGLCPLMMYCTSPDHYDIPIPDGHFTQYAYDEWLEKNRADGGGVPWEQKEERAVGRWTGYCEERPQLDRHGTAVRCVRSAYQNQSREHTGELTSFDGEAMSLSDQRAFKYSLHLDGIGCSNRLQKVMATGQTVLKRDSNLTEFFYAALKPWQHYVPVGWNGLEEAEWAVRFLRANDGLARTVGENAREFARRHLSEEGRLCYIKVLFEEMRKLMRYEAPPLAAFPRAISYDEEVKQHVPPVNNMELHKTE